MAKRTKKQVPVSKQPVFVVYAGRYEPETYRGAYTVGAYATEDEAEAAARWAFGALNEDARVEVVVTVVLFLGMSSRVMTEFVAPTVGGPLPEFLNGATP